MTLLIISVLCNKRTKLLYEIRAGQKFEIFKCFKCFKKYLKMFQIKEIFILLKFLKNNLNIY